MNYSLDGGAPDIGAKVWIAPNATVVGKVVLEAAANVWFGAVLRGDTEVIRVGAGSNVQDNCVLHTDTGFPLLIGANCTVGHAAILHGCTIGDGSLIGMGATIMNGARIGTGCMVGAGALVTEGRDIPDGMLVLGRPAKVARSLTEAEIARLLAAARHYRDNAARFAKGLQPIQM